MRRSAVYCRVFTSSFKFVSAFGSQLLDCFTFPHYYRKTGWANQNSAAPGIKEVQSNEFPEDAVARVERANMAFKQLNGTGLTQTPGILLVPGMASRVLAYQALSPDASKNQIIAIAEEAVNLALGLLPSATPSNTPLPISLPPIDDDNPKCVKGELSKHILVRNMFDKDEETEENWAEEIKAEFEEECSKYGTIQNVIVVSNEVGGKIFATFDSIEGAASCAENLAGRWFDKRQLRVEFVSETPSR
jgi:RNA-binding protein 39